MCSTPLLTLLDFAKPFVIECDASSMGIAAILNQEGRPLAFTGRQLNGKHLGQSTYEKEIMTILNEVYNW